MKQIGFQDYILDLETRNKLNKHKFECPVKIKNQQSWHYFC